jgi:bacterioferritin-associated ferredoxin
MIVCICNELNQEKIKETIQNHCVKIDAYEIHDVLECNVGCGKCLPTIISLIEENKQEKENNAN